MALTPPPDLLSRARAWLAEDPDPDTRSELAELLARAECGDCGDTACSEEGARAWSALSERFAEPLRFGTAGLRGALGAGPNRMNRCVVIRTAAGLAAFLKDRAARRSEDGSPAPLVVIGYDARHKSRDFAEDTAGVLTAAGLRAALLPEPLPTPVLAFAVRHLGAAAGVAITASHNPARDNGYKVYLGASPDAPEGPDAPDDPGAGAQLVPPADEEIAARVAKIGPLAGVPRAESGWEVLDGSLLAAYLERAVGVVDPATPRDLAVVYTPLHGVGRGTFAAAFKRAGFPAPTVVTEQAEPDPDFPTTPFPNPEERGAMALAFRTASAIGPDIVIANDPDADRCAVAVPDRTSREGWRMLRGDEVGALLAAHLVHKRVSGTFATSIVSSSVLGRIADSAGLPYAETLTGFKWLTRVPGLRYAYEEALGYCVDPDGVRDKDGITAALLVAELAAVLKESGRTLQDLLDDLALSYGLHATDQLAVRVEDPKQLAAAMDRLREQPPKVLAGLRVESAEDLAEGVPAPPSAAGSAPLPPTEGLRYRLSDPAQESRAIESARVIVRPSGTEPKLKCYLEVVLPVPSSDMLAPARASAAATLAALRHDLAAAAGLPPERA